MHDVRLVLEQFVDAFDDIPFPEHDFVPQGHEPVLHIGLETVYEVYSLVEECLEEFLLDITPVGEHLPVEELGEDAPHPSVPVVHVRPCQAEGYDLAGIIAQQVQLEAVAPSHRAFPVSGQSREHLVHVPPDVVAHGNHGAVHERDAGAFAEGVQLHEQHHQKEHPRRQFHEAVV